MPELIPRQLLVKVPKLLPQRGVRALVLLVRNS